MAWIFLVILVTPLWVVSLCKILGVSLSPSSAVHFSSGESLQKKNYLLVIAHPDDESMFFSPTINYLTARGHNVHVLCISTGNADGMGNIRKDELIKACATLKVPCQQLKVVDHPELQDGFGKVWDHSLVAKLIEDEIVSHGIDLVITFDNYGVSGHCNHRDVHFGTRRMLLDFKGRNVEAWELVSTNILRKYSGPIEIWLSFALAMLRPSVEASCILNEDPLRGFLAMAQHRSQWVWYRKLFVCFSRYSYVNTLRKINVEA